MLDFPHFILDTDDPSPENCTYIKVCTCSDDEIIHYKTNTWSTSFHVKRRDAAVQDSDHALLPADPTSVLDLPPSQPDKSEGSASVTKSGASNPTTKSGGTQHLLPSTSPDSLIHQVILPSWVQHNIPITYRPDSNHMFQKGILHQVDNVYWSIVFSKHNNQLKTINLSSTDIHQLIQ